jgi:hypothetical protein
MSGTGRSFTETWAVKVPDLVSELDGGGGDDMSRVVAAKKQRATNVKGGGVDFGREETSKDDVLPSGARDMTMCGCRDQTGRGRSVAGACFDQTTDDSCCVR